jgi:hypothetical protein
MANTNSSHITTLNTGGEAGTGGKLEPTELGGRLRINSGTVAVLAADIDADLDTVRLTRLPSNAAIYELWFAADDLGVDEADFGLYLPNGGDAVDIDCYIDDIDLDGQALAWTNYAFSGGVRDLLDVGQKVWEDAVSVYTSDPGGSFDLVMTRKGTTGTELPGDISWRIVYVVD